MIEFEKKQKFLIIQTWRTSKLEVENIRNTNEGSLVEWMKGIFN